MRGAEQPDGFSASNCQSIAERGGLVVAEGVDLFFSVQCKLNIEESTCAPENWPPVKCLCTHVNVIELVRLSWIEIAHGVKWQRFSQQRYAEQIITNFSIDFGVGEGGKRWKKVRKKGGNTSEVSSLSCHKHRQFSLGLTWQTPSLHGPRSTRAGYKSQTPQVFK